MTAQSNGNAPSQSKHAPHASLRETSLTFSRPLGINEFSYVRGRGQLGYTDSYTIARLSCAGGHVIADEEVVAACASLRLRHPLLGSKVTFSSPQFPELSFTAPLSEGHALRTAHAQIEFHTFEDQGVAAEALSDLWMSTPADEALDIRDATCSLWWGKSAALDAGEYVFGLRTTHFITDGRRRLNLVRCFMELLASPGRARMELAAHFAGDTPMVGMPPTLESLRPKIELSDEEKAKAKVTFNEVVKYIDKPLSGLVLEGPASADGIVARCIRHVWNEEETSHILKACKAQAVTITTLVNSASALASVRAVPEHANLLADDAYYFEFNQAIDLNSRVPRTSINGEVETANHILVYPIIIRVPRAAAHSENASYAVFDTAREFKARNAELVQSPYFWYFLDMYRPLLGQRYMSNLSGTSKPLMPYMSSLGELKTLLPSRYPVTHHEVKGNGANGVGGRPPAEIIIKDQTTAGRMDPQMVSFLLYTFDGKLHLQFKWNAGRLREACVGEWFKRTVDIISGGLQ
ncbi:hypothetical protein FOMPIDRAFT_1032543 [Fomitopsis schrenkii]|uniref:Condensation domain-containing protein n=1 Tax=Fomitopsis schrenkii TaxID=2126942 RepID=S8F311_FOMSC|nr:hypothetical protein FOMPIDRAFT_1032543 [Fomitopsis schrenkii]